MSTTNRIDKDKRQRRKPLWQVSGAALPELIGFRVVAWTKGEARAAIKRDFGLSKLPECTLLDRVPEEEEKEA